MEIQALSKGPERVFIVCRNDDGSSIAIGTPLEMKCDGTRDGIDVQAAQTAAQIGLCVGTAHASVADQKYFRAQCYGYDDDAVCYAHGTATNSNVVIGDYGFASSGGAITLVRPGGDFASVSLAIASTDAATVKYGQALFHAVATVGSSATSTVTTNHKVFIRCM